MARFPQIPEPKIEGRPDKQVGMIQLPNARGEEEAFQTGAETVGAIAGNVEQLESTRQNALDHMQKMVDGVTATRMAGDHAEKLRNLLTTLQTQYVDAPEKVPEEFRKQSLELTDGEISSAPSQRVALDLAEKNATIDNQQLATAHSWAQLRMVQKAKSDFTGLTNTQVRTAQAQTTLPGLNLAIANAEKTLRPLAENLHEEPDATMQKLKHDMALAWVESNSPQNPLGVAIALDQKKGPLVQYLDPKEVATAQRKAHVDLEGYGEIQRFHLAKETSDSGANGYEALLRGDLTPANAFQLNRALENKKTAIDANPNLTPEEKKAQGAIVDKNISTLRYYDEIARKPGRFNVDFDQEKQDKLLNDFFALGKPTDKTPKDLLKVVQLRHDLAEAEANRWISPARAQTMNKSLTQMTGKSLAHEAKNTGWPVSFMGFGGRSPQQAGNVALNDYFKDNKAFGKLTKDQENQARIEYLNQLNDATESGRNIDVKSAQTMAFEALKYVSGRAHRTVK